MPIKLSIDGLAEFKAALRKLPGHLRDEARDLVQGHLDRAEAAIAAAYATHSVTGSLASGLRQDRRTASFGVNIVLKSTAKHAYLFEEGTKRARENRRHAGRGRMPAAHAFVPRVVAAREAIRRDLVALLEREGFTVR